MGYYIDEQFKRRDEGHWFNNKELATYITGTHFMYLQWSKIDVGKPDFREANRLFFIFWEACKVGLHDATECVILKTVRSGFSFMSSAETVNLATISSDARFGILSKSGLMLKKCSQIRLYQYPSTTRSFFKPIQDGMDRPKTELAYRIPASSLPGNHTSQKRQKL